MFKEFLQEHKPAIIVAAIGIAISLAVAGGDISEVLAGRGRH